MTDEPAWRATARRMASEGRRIVTIARRLEQPRVAVRVALGLPVRLRRMILAAGCGRR